MYLYQIWNLQLLWPSLWFVFSLGIPVLKTEKEAWLLSQLFRMSPQV